MLYTPTTTDLEKMNRTDLVFEAAKKAHIDHYQTILTWPTEAIRNLLRHYKDMERRVSTLDMIALFLGADFAGPGTKSYTHTFVIEMPGRTYKTMVAGEALRPGPVKEWHGKIYNFDTKLDPIRKLKIK